MAHPYRSAGRAGAKSKFKAMLGTTNGAKHFNDDTVVNASTPVKNGIEDVKIMAKSPPKRLDRARGGQVAKKGVTVNVIIPPGKDAAPPIPPMPMPPAPPPMMPPKPPMGGAPGPGGPQLPTPGAGLPLPRARGGKVRADGGQAFEAARTLGSREAMRLQQEMAAQQNQKNQMGFDLARTLGSREAAQTIQQARASGGRATISQRAVKTQKGLQERINSMDPTPDTIKPIANPDYVPTRARGGYIGGEPKENKLKQWAQYARKNSYHKKDGGGITKAKLTAGADSGVGRLQHSKAQRKHMKD